MTGYSNFDCLVGGGSSQIRKNGWEGSKIIHANSFDQWDLVNVMMRFVNVVEEFGDGRSQFTSLGGWLFRVGIWVWVINFSRLFRKDCNFYSVDGARLLHCA